MKYVGTNRAVVVGDLVRYHGELGHIVFIIQEHAFLPDYPEREWGYLKKGIGVKIQGGDLFRIDEPDEDLMPAD